MELRNPHSILACLKKRPRDVTDLRLPAKVHGVWEEIMDLWGGKKTTASARKKSDGRAGGGLAVIRERAPRSLEELINGSQGEGVWLALDQVQDPQNLGAIFRSASFFGVKGLLLTSDRSAPLTATVYDNSAGGAEAVPFAMVPNLQQAFAYAKEQGLWILGTSEHAEQNLREIAPDRAWLVVLGNEERGLRRLTQERCDVVCRIPPRGEVTSLNVSVAAGVILNHLGGGQ